MVNTLQKPHCPYCAIELDDAPKRKKNCPNCGKPICVRKGHLVTEEEAYLQDQLVRLEKYDVNRQVFDEHRKILTKKFGNIATPNDTLWHIFNTLLIKTRDPNIQMNLYHEMARLVCMENKDPTPYIKQALTINLNILKKQGLKYVRIAGCGMQSDYSSCPNCKALHGKKISIDIALKEMPIPTLCTSKTGCRCSYVSEADWKLSLS